MHINELFSSCTSLDDLFIIISNDSDVEINILFKQIVFDDFLKNLMNDQ